MTDTVVENKICIIGNFEFPDGTAAGLRVLGNGRLFKKLGYEVIYIGLSRNCLPCKDNVPQFRYLENFKCYNFEYPTGIKEWLFFHKKLHSVKDILSSEGMSLVISYGSLSNSFFAIMLAYYCKRNHIAFVPDVVDWLAGGSGSRMFRIMKWVDTQIQKRVANKLGSGIIMISSCQKDYYRDGRPKLVLPPLSTYISDIDKQACINRNVTLVYAGYPFSVDSSVRDRSTFKDRLDVAIELLFLCRDLEFKFNVYGISITEYLLVIPSHRSIIEEMKDKVIFHGRCDRKEIRVATMDADYMFLYRDKNRMTDFGFPTKLVESLSYGTPVITTDTSDILKYINDGCNGYILDREDLEAGMIKLRGILSDKLPGLTMTKDEIIENHPFADDYFSGDASVFLQHVLDNPSK
jgi:glycosyltransferase involved in cell wall biosynthesis